ncbi:MAG: hypothetical protein IIC64_16265 [SAR324 cluster bacterium]|nr:hypothetical protein [SAR324 cluster bacterium]
MGMLKMLKYPRITPPTKNLWPHSVDPRRKPAECPDAIFFKMRWPWAGGAISGQIFEIICDIFYPAEWKGTGMNYFSRGFHGGFTGVFPQAKRPGWKS